PVGLRMVEGADVREHEQRLDDEHQRERRSEQEGAARLRHAVEHRVHGGRDRWENRPVNLWLAAVIVIGVTAIAVGAFLMVRRYAPEDGFFTDGDRAAGVFGVLATGFAVLLGFVVYLAFLSYDTARSGARAESSDVI